MEEQKNSAHKKTNNKAVDRGLVFNLKLIIFVIFGIVLPLYLAFGAMESINILTKVDPYSQTFEASVNPLSTESSSQNTIPHLDNTLATLHRHIPQSDSPTDLANDYTLATLVFLNDINVQIVKLKIHGKVALLHFAMMLMSLGVGITILGFSKNKVMSEAKVSFQEISIETPPLTVGCLLFISGALLSSYGATINNNYQTTGIPSFSSLRKEEQSPISARASTKSGPMSIEPATNANSKREVPKNPVMLPASQESDYHDLYQFRTPYPESFEVKGGELNLGTSLDEPSESSQ